MKRGTFTLVRAVAELANAVNGVRPIIQNGWLSVYTFMFGWPTTELAPLYLGGSVLDALRRGIRGDFNSPRGRIALLLHIIGWGLLGVLIRRNITSRQFFEQGLRDALGADYSTVDTADTAPVAPLLAANHRDGGVVGTSLVRRRYVKRTDVVRYGPYGGANLADIWHRADLPKDGKAPVLLQIPGGAWMIGMRRPQAYPLMAHLAERGWICVSIAYRISPRNTWPDHLIDVKRALAWVKENIADYGGDPNFVVVTGGSAGGHMTALTALTPNDPRYQPGFEDADTSVAAAVPVYGRYDWYSTEGRGRKEFMHTLQRLITKLSHAEHPHVYRDASPTLQVNADAPPFFVLHGTDDTLIPVTEAREFVAALRGVSRESVAYSEIPYAQHAFDVFGSPRGHYTAEVIDKFVTWVYRRYQERNAELNQVRAQAES